MDPSKTQQDRHYLFIDTCIIQAAGSKEKTKSEVVIKTLKEIANDYRLAISEISFYENLQGLWGKKATDASALLRSYEAKVVSGRVLTLASMLGGLYHDAKCDGVDTGDKIIAATAILETGLIFTENHKDYPNPFFKTEKSIPLTYLTAGKYNRTIDLAIYRPDISLIARRIKEKGG